MKPSIPSNCATTLPQSATTRFSLSSRLAPRPNKRNQRVEARVAGICLSPALSFCLKPTAARQPCPTTSCPRTTTTTTTTFVAPALDLGALDDGDGSDLRGSVLRPVVVDATPPPLTALATMVDDARGGRRCVIWDGFLGA